MGSQRVVKPSGSLKNVRAGRASPHLQTTRESFILQVALRAVVLQPGGVSAGRRDWLVVSTILRQAPGP
jgi:hypothetical protein